MPLHPQVRQMLAEMEAEGLPPLEKQTVEQLRQGLIETSASFGPGAELHEVRDLAIDGPAGDFRVRLYRPRPGNLAAVVYYHGGGWVAGSIETHDAFCRDMAQASGMLVASVEYHCAPEHTFPTATEEAYAALVYLQRHAAGLQIEARRLAVAGDSAGGNLAVAACLMARDRGTPQPSSQVLIYPVTDCNFDTASYREFATGYLLTRDAMRWFWDQYVPNTEDRANPCAAPMCAEDLRGLPISALVITAEYDPLRDEGEAFARRLSDAGVNVTLRRAEGMVHGFLRRTTLDGARAAQGWIASFLRERLGAC